MSGPTRSTCDTLAVALAAAIAMFTASCGGLHLDVESQAELTDDAKASAHMFERRDHEGRTISLERELEERRVVLVFYRGYW